MKTFLRRTFDEVREVTRRVCSVRLLQLFENSGNLALGASFEGMRRENRAQSLIPVSAVYTIKLRARARAA
jgi:hypothetical protein